MGLSETKVFTALGHGGVHLVTKGFVSFVLGKIELCNKVLACYFDGFVEG